VRIHPPILQHLLDQSPAPALSNRHDPRRLRPESRRTFAVLIRNIFLFREAPNLLADFNRGEPGGVVGGAEPEGGTRTGVAIWRSCFAAMPLTVSRFGQKPRVSTDSSNQYRRDRSGRSRHPTRDTAATSYRSDRGATKSQDQRQRGDSPAPMRRAPGRHWPCRCRAGEQYRWV
jgi:hypothetical protein